MVDGDYEAFTRRIDIDEAQLDAALLAIERYDGNASPSPREAGRALLLGRLGGPAPRRWPWSTKRWDCSTSVAR